LGDSPEASANFFRIPCLSLQSIEKRIRSISSAKQEIPKGLDALSHAELLTQLLL
jgi:hypothetical protein